MGCLRLICLTCICLGIREQDFESMAYIESPYGNWPTQGSLGLASTMSTWYRDLPGTNILERGNLVLKYNEDTGKHRLLASWEMIPTVVFVYSKHS